MYASLYSTLGILEPLKALWGQLTMAKLGCGYEAELRRPKGFSKCCKEVNISGQGMTQTIPGTESNPRVTFCSFDHHISHLRSIYLKIPWHNSLYNYRITGARTCITSSIHPPFPDGVTRAKGGKSRDLGFFTRANPPIPQPHPQLPPTGTGPPGTGPTLHTGKESLPLPCGLRAAAPLPAGAAKQCN